METDADTYLLIGALLFLPAFAVLIYMLIRRARFTRMRHRKRRH